MEALGNFISSIWSGGGSSRKRTREQEREATVESVEEEEEEGKEEDVSSSVQGAQSCDVTSIKDAFARLLWSTTKAFIAPENEGMSNHDVFLDSHELPPASSSSSSSPPTPPPHTAIVSTYKSTKKNVNDEEAFLASYSYYYEQVEEADWGSVRKLVVTFCFDDDVQAVFNVVRVTTDGDDGWMEIFDSSTGTYLCGGRTYLELIHFVDTQEELRSYTLTSSMPPDFDTSKSGGANGPGPWIDYLDAPPPPPPTTTTPTSKPKPKSKSILTSTSTPASKKQKTTKTSPAKKSASGAKSTKQEEEDKHKVYVVEAILDHYLLDPLLSPSSSYSSSSSSSSSSSCTTTIKSTSGKKKKKDMKRGDIRNIELLVKWEDFEEPSRHPAADFVKVDAFKSYLAENKELRELLQRK